MEGWGCLWLAVGLLGDWLKFHDEESPRRWRMRNGSVCVLPQCWSLVMHDKVATRPAYLIVVLWQSVCSCQSGIEIHAQPSLHSKPTTTMGCDSSSARSHYHHKGTGRLAAGSEEQEQLKRHGILKGIRGWVSGTAAAAAKSGASV